MAEVVKVPVVGSVPKPWLYAGGAAVAGIVGYAWWTAGSRAEEDQGFAVELPVTDYKPPTVVDSGISVGGATPTPGLAENNAEWLSMARETAAGLGFAVTVIATGLTKYLAKLPVTATEASMIRAVVNVLGPPPNNGPFPITEEIPPPPPPHEEPPPPPPPNQPPSPNQPPPPAGPGAPSAPPWVSAIGHKDAIELHWGAASGATWYEFVRIAGSSLDTPWTNVGNTTQLVWPQDVDVDTHYAYAVRAGGPGGYGPPTMSNDVWILR